MLDYSAVLLFLAVVNGILMAYNLYGFIDILLLIRGRGFKHNINIYRLISTLKKKGESKTDRAINLYIGSKTLLKIGLISLVQLVIEVILISLSMLFYNMYQSTTSIASIVIAQEETQLTTTVSETTETSETTTGVPEDTLSLVSPITSIIVETNESGETVTRIVEITTEPTSDTVSDVSSTLTTSAETEEVINNENTDNWVDNKDNDRHNN